MLVQRKQKTLGSRLAGKATKHTALCGRTGVDGIAKASTVRLKDVKVVQNWFHGDLLNKFVSGFIKQAKDNQVSNDVVSKQVHLFGQLGDATKLIGDGDGPVNTIVLFHGDLLCPKPVVIGSTVIGSAGIAKFTNRRIGPLGDNKAVLNLKLGTAVTTNIINGGTNTLFHNILQTRINHLGSKSHNRRMMN